MQGAGNDFMVIDGIHQSIHLTVDQIRYLSERHLGVGFDQLLIIESPRDQNSDFYYRIFNANGQEVGQCGNGARCLARYAYEQGLTKKKRLRVTTQNTHLDLILLDDDRVTVILEEPRFAPKDIPFSVSKQAKTYFLKVDGKRIEFSVVNVGNPHAVIIVPDIEAEPVEPIGPILTRHPSFPEDVNVGFMQIVNEQLVCLRVYEKGVIDETLACGSGACAAAVVGISRRLLRHNVEVMLTGGTLDVEWQGAHHPIKLTGPAKTVFQGQIVLPASKILNF